MKLSDREIATVLAALRQWQASESPAWAARAIACGAELPHFGHEHAPLNNEEIDQLCQKINFGESEG